MCCIINIYEHYIKASLGRKKTCKAFWAALFKRIIKINNLQMIEEERT